MESKKSEQAILSIEPEVGVTPADLQGQLFGTASWFGEIESGTVNLIDRLVRRFERFVLLWH
ncbi:MAG: hypothetical protein M2R46_04408 [Verrucomicrobia subdivision 3 bacterium]|nr:hypothetical protein [Limisphaerales bacterium]